MVSTDTQPVIMINSNDRLYNFLPTITESAATARLHGDE